MKTWLKYEKIVPTICIPLVGFCLNYIQGLNNKVTQLEQWKIEIVTRNTPVVLIDIDKRMTFIEKDMGLITLRLNTLDTVGTDRHRRNTLKFDEHEKALKTTAVDIAYIQGRLSKVKK